MRSSPSEASRTIMRQKYYDFYIEDYVSSYIFKDYLDLTACKQYQIVLRVWEACGIPAFDPHIWPCSRTSVVYV
ncbi:MAG: hypothetical protein IPP42_01580 [Saprospiraceae bacterium]|nr:hypothetical protein [Saprospiraceae bacterium]